MAETASRWLVAGCWRVERLASSIKQVKSVQRGIDMVAVYTIERNCCLGPCCHHKHQPNKPVRVKQLITLDKSSADRCVAGWREYQATLSIEEVDSDDVNVALRNYAIS